MKGFHFCLHCRIALSTTILNSRYYTWRIPTFITNSILIICSKIQTFHRLYNISIDSYFPSNLPLAFSLNPGKCFDFIYEAQVNYLLNFSAFSAICLKRFSSTFLSPSLQRLFDFFPRSCFWFSDEDFFSTTLPKIIHL